MSHLVRALIALASISICSLPHLAYASDRFESLLRSPSLSTYPTLETRSELEGKEMQAQLGAAIKYLREQEHRLSNNKAAIEQYGHTALSFTAEMQKAVDSMNEETILKVLNTDPSDIDSLNIPEVSEVRLSLTLAEPLVAKLMSDLDSYIVESLDVALAIGIYSVREHLSMFPRSDRLTKQYSRLIKLLNAYLEAKHEYGQPKDVKRTSAFKGFFKTLRETYQIVERSHQSIWTRISRKISNSLGRVAYLNRFLAKDMFDDVFALIKTIWTVEQPIENLNPFMAKTNSIMRNIGNRMGETVVLEEGSREILDGLSPGGDGKDIFVFTPGHRDGLRDQIGLSHLDINDMVPFAAFPNFLPNFLNMTFKVGGKVIGFPLKDKIIAKINNNNGAIVVGQKGGVDPIDKMLDIFQSTDLRSILIYPGGRLPEGLGYTMGVRSKFLDLTEGPMAKLELAGFRVHIVPISMRDNAKLFGTRALTRSKELHVKVAPVLTHNTRHVLAHLIGAHGLGLLMRYGLIEDMITNDELLWGQMRGSMLGSALSEYLLGDLQASCANLLVE